MFSCLRVFAAASSLRPVSSALVVATRGISNTWKLRRPNRSPKVKVILTKDVPKLGNQGAVVAVERGHARNDLVPNANALFATPENLEKYKSLLREHDTTVMDQDAKLDGLVRRIQRKFIPVVIPVDKATNFSISKQQVLHLLATVKYLSVEPQAVKLDEPITTYGEHLIPVVVTGDRKANLKLVVSAAERKKMEEEPKKK